MYPLPRGSGISCPVIMSNKEIRELMKKENIYIWQVANKLSIHETTLIKRFRTELPEERRTEVLSAIEEIRLERLKN